VLNHFFSSGSGPITPTQNETSNEICSPPIEQLTKMSKKAKFSDRKKENKGGKDETVEDLVIHTPTMTRNQYRANQVAPILDKTSWMFLKEMKQRETGTRGEGNGDERRSVKKKK
jgi:hypothetical protein